MKSKECAPRQESRGRPAKPPQTTGYDIRFRELFSHMPSGVAVFRPLRGGSDFLFVDFNKAAERIEKISAHKVIGRLLSKVFPGVESMGIMKVFRRVARTGKAEHLPATVYQDARIMGWRDNYVYRLPTGEVVAVYDDVTERKKAEEELRESERRFRSIVENVNDAYLIHDFNRQIIDCNDNAAQLFGLSREKLLASHLVDIVSQEAIEGFGLHMRTLKKKGSVVFESFHHRKGGERVDVIVSSRMVSSAGGGRIQSFIRDISEQKRAERALKEEKAVLESVLDATLAGYWDWDMASGTEKLSPRMRAMLGYGARELPDKPGALKELVHPDDLPGVMDSIDRHVRTRGRVPLHIEVRLRHKNGSFIWVILAGRVVKWGDDGKPLRIVGCHVDITSHKSSERARSESEGKYRTIVMNLDDGVLIHDFAGNIREASASLCAMLGYPANGLAGRSLRDIMMPGREDALTGLLERLRRDERLATDAVMCKADGTPLQVNVRARMVSRLGEGSVQGVIRDITERKRMEEDLRSDVAMRETLLEFLPGMAMILKGNTREVVFANAMARHAGALPGSRCHKIWRGMNEPCPFCCAPDAWKTRRPTERIVEFRGKRYDCRWFPITGDQYAHFIFEIPDKEPPAAEAV